MTKPQRIALVVLPIVIAICALLAFIVRLDDGLAANTFGGLHIRLDKPQYDQGGFCTLELQLTNASDDFVYEYDMAESFQAGTLDGQLYKFVGSAGTARAAWRLNRW